MMTEDRFDQILDELRNESAPAGEMEAAIDRVRQRLENPVCAEFRSEFGAYLGGRILESRRLLLEDHLTRCAQCRHALAEARGERPSAPVISISSSARFRRFRRWAIAAGVAVVALYAGRDRVDSMMAPSGARATVESVDGQLIALGSGAMLRPGATLQEGDTVRTPNGSRAALRLRDGSLVEMNERSQLYVRAQWSGQRVHLDRGDAIVQAAKQRRGRLQLITRDATSSVKGTVFAVSTGVAGSVVSVVEGAVEVAQAGSERVLKAGEQVSTSDSLRAAGVREAISWSPNAEKYFALLAEFANLEKQISAIVTPGLRTRASLLPRMLPDTYIYATVPNTEGAIERSLRLIEQRARENAVLKEWWEGNKDLKAILERLQAASGLLGDEIGFQVGFDPANRQHGLAVVLAEAKPGREAALKEAMDKIVAATKGSTAYAVNGGLLLISEDAATLAKVQPLLGRGASSPFAAEIARRYQRGVGWLWAVDTAAIFARQNGTQHSAMLSALGFAQMRHLVLEQRGGSGRDENEVSANFQGARQGVASWMAAPGAFGSSEYVSSGAIVAVSAATRNPRQAFDELVANVGRVQPKFVTELREFEQKTGISVANDIASALGTDFSYSLENVALPNPGWVGAVEAYSPAGIDAAAKRVVDAANRQPGVTQKFTLKEETVSGRKWVSVSTDIAAHTLHWTYDRGYMIFGPDRAVLMRAITNRASGTPLIRSAKFRELQPATPSVHNSGFVWLNTRGALESMVQAAGQSMPASLQSLLTSRDPVLIVFNGETERIAAFSRTRLTSLLIDLMLTSPASGGQASPAPGRKAVHEKTLHATTGD